MLGVKGLGRGLGRNPSDFLILMIFDLFLHHFLSIFVILNHLLSFYINFSHVFLSFSSVLGLYRPLSEGGGDMPGGGPPPTRPSYVLVWDANSFQLKKFHIQQTVRRKTKKRLMIPILPTTSFFCYLI